MSENLYVEDLIIEKYDEILKDILAHGHTHYTLYGGRGSTKSSFISEAILLLLTRPENRNIHAVIFRKVAGTLRDSVYAQIAASISLLGIEQYFKLTVSPMEITYLQTGQKILFRGLDAKEKIKSIKAPFGYFGITWFEELDQFAGRDEIRSVLQSTMRGKSGRFWNFESFNPPITVMNWANKDLLIEDKDRLVVKSSYLDVPVEWLSEQFFEEAEKLKKLNPKAYEHEYLGVPVGTGGNVFENLTVREIKDEDIDAFDRVYHGLDFGWYPDPNAFVKCYYNMPKRTLYIFGEFKSNKQNNIQIAESLAAQGITKDDEIICDNDKKAIADLREMGFSVFMAAKKPGSVNYSMKWLQGLTEIVIDRGRCPNAAEEFQSYEYERTKGGEIITSYPDKNNHFIDATRYALNRLWQQRGV